MNLNDVKDNKVLEPRHIIVYGQPKSGKTELVGALAKDYHLWTISLDAGYKTWLRKDSAAYPYLKNIDIFPIADSQQYPMGVETMLKVLRQPAKNVSICEKHGKVACPLCTKDGAPMPTLPLADFKVDKDILVIDNYAQLMNSVMNHILSDSLGKDNFDAKGSWDDWRKQGSISDRFGSTIQVAPYNVIVISQEIMIETEDGGKKIAPIGGTRNKSSDFAGFFDDCVFCEVIGGKYVAYSSAEKKTRVVVGSRTGKSLQDTSGKQLGLVELFK
jgi:phage anti-repressor protein